MKGLPAPDPERRRSALGLRRAHNQPSLASGGRPPRGLGEAAARFSSPDSIWDNVIPRALDSL